ncbi:MAG: hypothetical protein IKK65_03890 [Clostridia bacterium]|nr:hypothetical protein [Clostridia bacterium]MBR4117202.1 hypothetical protein [Clostridia bacterium]
MSTPIELHFYNKNNELIKTYKQDRISWDFLKRAVKIRDVNTLDESNIDIITEFVCEFYGNCFSKFGKKANKRTLLKHTDVEQLLAVAGQIITRVMNMMKENGVSLPNVPAATK